MRGINTFLRRLPRLSSRQALQSCIFLQWAACTWHIVFLQNRSSGFFPLFFLRQKKESKKHWQSKELRKTPKRAKKTRGTLKNSFIYEKIRKNPKRKKKVGFFSNLFSLTKWSKKTLKENGLSGCFLIFFLRQKKDRKKPQQHKDSKKNRKDSKRFRSDLM